MVLRVAVVGAGAAGMYAVQHLLEQDAFEVEIDLFERLPTPWGLIRAGVAPDHPEKKQITDRLFQFYLKRSNLRFFGNIDIGFDLAHDELAAFYDAVIYAVGADDDKPLGIAGEDLSGSWSARQFVAWYNGHPDYRDLPFDFSDPRAVIVGTGNVALDVARILTVPPAILARTDIADHALEALRGSRVKEVIVLGRRGCRDAAFHNPELEELLYLPGVDVEIHADDMSESGPPPRDWQTARKLTTLRYLHVRHVDAPEKRIIFKFHQVPISVCGRERISGLKVQRPGSSEVSEISCGLLLRSIGYRGRPFPGLPFDAHANVISNVAGRVVDGSAPRSGVYVTGWIKRGPRGVIGSNKRCAGETVACLLEDARAGRLAGGKAGDVERMLRKRKPDIVSHQGWQRIDIAERKAGLIHGRPRIKQTGIHEMLASAGIIGGPPR